MQNIFFSQFTYNLDTTIFVGFYAGHALSVNTQNVAAGSAAYNALAGKLIILEHFNGRTFNAVPADAAANDETWRMAT
ncbi:hypothetical protein IVG45_06005 [Methylomonas sp. LL1]|uniref:hypothetical protein n=1 Tax=Methylomonas sp. LL1 TaxID=2785785 RepID=UPI0018C366EE|nr:hypothetical protein [Methylomonas sp. LL1]QPK64520.1 hypothetical protein IVG45_06005 [Methylomonas sp. LL1]